MHTYEIRVQGCLDPHWSEWFNGLAITHDADGNTVLRGPLADEAALHGVVFFKGKVGQFTTEKCAI